MRTGTAFNSDLIAPTELTVIYKHRPARRPSRYRLGAALQKIGSGLVVPKHAQSQQQHDSAENQGIKQGEMVEEGLHHSILPPNRILQKPKCSKYYRLAAIDKWKRRIFLSGAQYRSGATG